VVTTTPWSAKFAIFQDGELSKCEEEQMAALMKVGIPTVKLNWLVRMDNFGHIENWTQWACDAAYSQDPLVEDKEAATLLHMLGVDNIEDESIELEEIWNCLSQKV
jgi:hypothetical protein